VVQLVLGSSSFIYYAHQNLQEADAVGDIAMLKLKKMIS
jgi:hypothetical protein